MRHGSTAKLPDFPWDRLEPAKAIASAHPGGLVDLSIGTPVDPVPRVVRTALTEGADAPGYPPVAGTPALQDAIKDWVRRTCEAPPGIGVLPTIGSKELVAWLPTLLGIGPGDTVVIPTICYPTYEVGARLAGAEVIRADSVDEIGSAKATMIWLNSPSNPTGQVLSEGHLRDTVTWARERGTIVASDECYLTLGWGVTPRSVLSVAESPDGVLALNSLSKRSNMAGYRAAFVAGDPALIAGMLEIRKHAGMMVPQPVQTAMIAALGDELHVFQQRKRYRGRRERLRAAIEKAGFTVEHSHAGLYLWATRGEDCWASVDWLAQRGVLVGPGSFYGPAGDNHVRISLTATDERIDAAVARLT